jgi:hypothetical protein
VVWFKDAWATEWGSKKIPKPCGGCCGSQITEKDWENGVGDRTDKVQLSIYRIPTTNLYYARCRIIAGKVRTPCRC